MRAHNSRDTTWPIRTLRKNVFERTLGSCQAQWISRIYYQYRLILIGNLRRAIHLLTSAWNKVYMLLLNLCFLSLATPEKLFLNMLAMNWENLSLMLRNVSSEGQPILYPSELKLG